MCVEFHCSRSCDIKSVINQVAECRNQVVSSPAPYFRSQVPVSSLRPVILTGCSHIPVLGIFHISKALLINSDLVNTTYVLAGKSLFFCVSLAVVWCGGL
jgi:hypothetical protein